MATQAEPSPSSTDASATNSSTLWVKRLHSNAVLPQRAHPSDAGFDVVALAMQPKQAGVFAFNTGLALQPPLGFYVQVVARSSIAKTSFVLANALGVIDPDYRGAVQVLLRYVGQQPAQAHSEAQALVGTRIAQLLVLPLPVVQVQEVSTLAASSRGVQGLGSTGSKPFTP